MPHKILVAQGGGPTAVINQSLAGVALEARRFPDVTHVYGALSGVRGIVNDDLVDLGQETVANLEAVAATPAAALGSTRDKPDRLYCQEIFKVLKAHAIDTFFYIGGNDSSDTVRIVAEEAKKGDHGLRAIHIPKTIDNDLVGFDHTPGYPSAARFVTQAFAGANLDNLALQGVYVAVVMGRHAGFLTAASALARKYPDDGPHLIYLPERTFVVDKFLADVKAAFERHGRCIVAVSEGIHDDKGEAIITKLVGKAEKDAHGNVQLSGTGALADALVRGGQGQARHQAECAATRSATCSARSSAASARSISARRVRSARRRCNTRWRGQGTDRSRSGASAIMRSTIRSFQLETVAGKTRVMEDHLINAAGNDVTPAFHDYLRPLLGADVIEVARLRAAKVEKAGVLSGDST